MALDLVQVFDYPVPVNLFANLTVDQLKRAVAIKERIEELERELQSVIGKSGSRNRSKSRRRMSAAARAKIAAAARARWARYRAAKGK